MKTWIKSLETSDGYLRNAKISLVEGLTCIIGARGTCKSTIVETLRFVHDLDPARLGVLVDAEPGASATHGPRGLLRETLAGGTATCTTSSVDAEGTTSELRIERSVGSDRPRVYRDGVVETASSPLAMPIEIYSQGDLVTIAENPSCRLQLVDRPHVATIERIRGRLAAAQRRIEQLGGEMLALRTSIHEDGRDLGQLAELEQQLEAIKRDRPALDPRLESERAAFEAREHVLALARGICEHYATLLSSELPEPPTDGAVAALEQALAAASLEPARRLSSEVHELAAAVRSLEQQLALARALATRARTSISALHDAFEERNRRYRDLRRDQEALSASLEQEDLVRAQLRRLYQLRDAIEQRRARLAALAAQREALRREVEACLDEVFALRLSEIENINADLEGISLSIVQGGQSSAYAEALAELLQGTRLKRQREIAARITELLSPSELVDVIEQERVEHLAEIAGLERSQSSRIVNHFLDDMARVLRLETIPFEDRLDIAMNVDGVVRPVEQLSRGQMATALLPLILRHANFPLVFDQPEDDLDNRFVFDELVKRIRELKRTRQLVFVTHNANIPVLGDADRVIMMSMVNARLAATPVAGTVDEMKKAILDILEGGAVAFQERRKRYQGVL